VLGTALNQSSDARLLTLNSIDDFCLFAPPNPGAIADTETEEVAWCTKPRNNARLIPDGTFTDVSFIKTDFYVQIIGFGNLTNLNIPEGDQGGELDPHGAYGSGNPIGGNVTTNVTGSELAVGEWMQFISYSQFCIRACTNANSTYSAPEMCEHKLDEMGCMFVMYVLSSDDVHVRFLMRLLGPATTSSRASSRARRMLRTVRFEVLRISKLLTRLCSPWLVPDCDC
jgi:hypothetical protein